MREDHLLLLYERRPLVTFEFAQLPNLGHYVKLNYGFIFVYQASVTLYDM